MTQETDILIVGAGLVGLSTALACAHKGAEVILIDAVDPYKGLDAGFDGRASAIAAACYDMFRTLGLDMDSLEAQPMADIVIAEGQAGRECLAGLHLDADMDTPTGYMVENRLLRKALLEKVAKSEVITLRAPVRLENWQDNARHVSAKLSDKTSIEASVLVAADGRNSWVRRQAGIEVQSWAYNQKALTTTLQHSRPHQGMARQFFFPTGPLALLPLSGQRTSLVWSDDAVAIDAALALDETAFLSELERRIGGILGDVTLCAPRVAYPLSLMQAEHYHAGRCVLVGDAAHVIHPLAGQGLNLGLRDAAALADIVSEARSLGLDMGGAVLASYDQHRRSDAQLMAASTDMLSRIFGLNTPFTRGLRRTGLKAVEAIPGLRHLFVSEASGQSGELPSLMR